MGAAIFFPIYCWKYSEVIWDSENCYFLFLFISESTRNWFETPGTAFFFSFLFLKVLGSELRVWELLFSFPFYFWKYSEVNWEYRSCYFLFLLISESTRKWFETPGTAFVFSFLFLKLLGSDLRLWELLFSFFFFISESTRN